MNNSISPPAPGQKWREMIIRFKSLQGSPRYVALGMGIGVYVGVTPTVPFHTILALLLAVFFKASKPAAILGVWFCNPITLLPLYWGCYKFGSFLFGGIQTEFGQIMQILNQIEAADGWTLKFSMAREFLHNEAMVATAMMVGGIILGIVPGVGAYWLTLLFMKRLRQRQVKR